MFKYTLSAARESFDFFKRLINAFFIGIQVVYIGFLTYRLIIDSGNIIINIVLLMLSFVYLLYHIATIREFYTKSLITQRKTVKWIVKISKYIANICIITTSVILLLDGKAANENAAMLATILMIVGVLFSLVFDITLVLIERQMELIKAAALYDAEVFKAHHEFFTAALKKLGLDLEKQLPSLDDDKKIDRVKRVNHKQEQKQARKRDFVKKTKKT